MAETKTVYVCSACGEQWPKWAGQYRVYGEWGTLEESAVGALGSGFMRDQPTGRAGVGKPAPPAQPIGAFVMQATARIPSEVAEFDRVLAGDIVSGAVILLAGGPGIGKSALLLEIAATVARGDKSGESNKATGEMAQVMNLGRRRGDSRDSNEGRRILYLMSEETVQQVYSRARRIDVVADKLLLVAETLADQALNQIKATAPALTIVDSIQTLADPLLDTSIGGPVQVREVTAKLTATARSRNMGLLLVGHVIKDGAAAGPRTLERPVDVMLQFEGECIGELRLLRAVKNHYKPTDTVGSFQIAEPGIEGIADLNGLFLSQTVGPVSGSCVTISLEGRWALPIETETLATLMAAGSPRRIVPGLDYSQVFMMLVVLQARMRLSLGTPDIYVSMVGGARVVESAVDSAVALTAASAIAGQATGHRLVALREVSLIGEIRSYATLSRRLAEAACLGFTTAAVPVAGAKKPSAPRGLSLRTAKDLREALALALHPFPGAQPAQERG